MLHSGEIFELISTAYFVGNALQPAPNKALKGFACSGLHSYPQKLWKQNLLTNILMKFALPVFWASRCKPRQLVLSHACPGSGTQSYPQKLGSGEQEICAKPLTPLNGVNGQAMGDGIGGFTATCAWWMPVIGLMVAACLIGTGLQAPSNKALRRLFWYCSTKLST